jgi:hypothetical protein
MDSGSTKLQPQRIRVDARKGRQGHRRVGDQQANHPPGGELEAAHRHRGDEHLSAALEVPDHDGQSLARPGHRDLIGLLHRLKGGDVHALLEPADDRLVRRALTSVEDVGRSLAPGRVRDLGDDAVERAPRVEQEEERDGVEADAVVARVRQQEDRPRRTSAEANLDPLTGALREVALAAREVVAVAKACRCGAARRPERDPIEQPRQLAQVQQRHEDPVTERVLDRSGAAVRHPAFVDRRSPHAACGMRSRAGPAGGAAGASSPSWGRGPRPPSISATRRADQTPSSWKPQRQ